jgi:hypothetical protein
MPIITTARELKCAFFACVSACAFELSQFT